ncbi:MAG: PIG-L family deacetylase [Anaerolineae bacterium]|nr:PIG-L family deacetylase [Anaerolineae bacterium]
MNFSDDQKPQRLLCVLAHPDDEVFCAGGTLALAAASGIETMVVSATRGEAGQIQDARIATRRTLGRVREGELLQSTQQLGVHHSLCLDYGDGTLAEVEPVRLVNDITRIIRDFRPDTVITFGPDGAYGHPDHIAIGAATTEAVKVSGDVRQFPEHRALGLAPHTPDRLYYSYFPRKPRLLADRLVQWLVALRRRFQGTADFGHALLIFSEEATMLGYVSDYVETSWFPAGFTIIEQDEPASKLYLILSGEVTVYREDNEGERHVLARVGPGHFFGEEGLAYRQPRNAHVVAEGNVTCLVFSPQTPTNFAGRGVGAQLVDAVAADNLNQTESLPDDIASVDVTPYVPQKVAALAAHQTQFPFKSDLLPLPILRELFGYEYFVPVYS